MICVLTGRLQEKKSVVDKFHQSKTFKNSVMAN